MNPYMKANYQWWNEIAPIHAASKFYDVEGFLKGKSTLTEIEREKLGDLHGKSVLHLQCHFGMDSCSLARWGAKVTGIDFSDEAIRLARDLNNQLGLDANFVCSNLYDLPQHLTGQYDIVYTSYGVLCWLNDLPRWAEIISHFLKPGGLFLVADGHPLSHVFELDKQGQLHIEDSYFYEKEPIKVTEDGTYADHEAKLTNRTTYEWMHSLSDIMNALWSAGLKIESFDEYPYGFYEKFEGLMEKNQDGWWVFKNKQLKLPLMFSITARKG